jgi:hypothetical protein
MGIGDASITKLFPFSSTGLLVIVLAAVCGVIQFVTTFHDLHADPAQQPTSLNLTAK